MLVLDFERLPKIKGMDLVEALIKRGMDRHKAWRLVSGRTKRINIEDLEAVCRVLKCTPNDVMRWVPKAGDGLEPNEGLNQLVRPERDVDFKAYLAGLSAEEMEELRGRMGI